MEVAADCCWASIHFLTAVALRGRWGAGAHPSSLWEEGGIHPGRVASTGQHSKPNNYSHLHHIKRAHSTPNACFWTDGGSPISAEHPEIWDDLCRLLPFFQTYAVCLWPRFVLSWWCLVWSSAARYTIMNIQWCFYVNVGSNKLLFPNMNPSGYSLLTSGINKAFLGRELLLTGDFCEPSATKYQESHKIRTIPICKWSPDVLT